MSNSNQIMTNEANPTTEVRRRISRDLFRSILWIDEEIFWFTTNSRGEKEYKYEQFHELFQPVTQELQAEGYLVHLHSFEQSTKEIHMDDEFSEESPSLASAIALAKKSDIVLLDWHLGSGNNPENSIKILEALVSDKATRFVLILSKYSDDFDHELSTHKGNHPDSSLSGLTYRELTKSWTTNCGLHIRLLNKRENGLDRIKGEAVSRAVYDLVSIHYPDYLHWAALEIAEKFRSHVPEWLQSLPTETDASVLQELLDDHSEIRSYLPENLLDNLVQIASANSLESFHSDNTKREHWANRPPFIQDQPKSKVENYINVLKSAKSIRKDFQEIHAGAKNMVGGTEWIDSQQDLIEFCENLPLRGNSPLPGSIYISIGEEKQHEFIYICVSQECDCMRSSPLLFVKAVRNDEVKANSTSLRFNGATYRVESKAENLLQLPVNENRSIDSYQRAGQLRRAIAMRIISRFWSGTTRPAVNHPTFARALRSGEA